MELLGFRQCIESLIAYGLVFDTLITDRHTSIAKYMRENLANIKHYFDLWHLRKSEYLILNFYIYMVCMNNLLYSDST